MVSRNTGRLSGRLSILQVCDVIRHTTVYYVHHHGVGVNFSQYCRGGLVIGYAWDLVHDEVDDCDDGCPSCVINFNNLEKRDSEMILNSR